MKSSIIGWVLVIVLTIWFGNMAFAIVAHKKAEAECKQRGGVYVGRWMYVSACFDPKAMK